MSDSEILSQLEQELEDKGIMDPIRGTKRVGFENHSIQRLDLTNLSLERLPILVTQLSQLKSLSLSNNKLTALPEQFSKLSQLQVLELTNNAFTHFPQPILGMRNLTYLNLERNNLHSIPFDLIYMDLKFLLTGYNPQLDQYSATYTHYISLRIGWEPGDPHPIHINKLYKYLVLKKVKEYLYKGKSLDTLIPKIERANGRSTENLEYHLITLITNPKELLILRLTNPKFSPIIKRRYARVQKFNPIIGELQVLIGKELLQYDRLPTDKTGYIKLKNDIISGLSLYDPGLIQFPVGIAELIELETLILDHNRIPSLPDIIGNMNALRVFSIKSNCLTNLPSAFMQLHGLENLVLSNNDLSGLSIGIGSLSSLEMLVMDSCNLSSTPTGVNDLSNLEVLNLSNNPDVTINSQLGELTELKRLDLENTGLDHISFDLSQMNNLKEINLSNNSLTAIPPALETLPNIEEINLQNNNISVDMDEIRAKYGPDKSKFDRYRNLPVIV